MQVFKTLVALEGTNRIVKVDTIRHDGRLWLVPEWIEVPSEGWSRPRRIVLLAEEAVEPTTTGGATFLLKTPMPKAVLDGLSRSGSAGEYVVVEEPEIRLLAGGKGPH